MARRDAERIEREKRLQTVLAEFFHAQGEAERIREAADVAAAPFDATMRDSVRTLDALGETRAGIANLTGLPLTRVREHLADDAPSSTTQDHEASGSEGEARREQPKDANARKLETAASSAGDASL